MNNYNKYFKSVLTVSAIASVAITANLFLMTAAAKSNPDEPHAQVCPGGGKDSVRCHAHVIIDKDGLPKTSVVPPGYGPAQFRGAYGVSGSTLTKQIVAVVDAYDHSKILSDLNFYSDTFGIPRLPACVGPIAQSSVPCFQKVNQRGSTTSFPRVDAGWALEIALDVEAVHAMCQNCGILLVEADSNSYANLMAAVDRAVILGANVISNSYGSGEFAGETSYDSHFNHSGIAITFSSGDSGYGAEYPAASAYVSAVGGTTLNINSDNSYNSESVWSGSGSGCSAYESKPTFQTDPGCSQRTVADISADADPNTGAAVYDSVRYQGRSGWYKVGGTSLASPLIAGVYALAGGVPAGVYGNALLYSQGNSSNLNDILYGSNGACSSAATYLCTAVPGYDGPTGLGTPKGMSAF